MAGESQGGWADCWGNLIMMRRDAHFRECGVVWAVAVSRQTCCTSRLKRPATGSHWQPLAAKRCCGSLSYPVQG